MKKDLPSFAPGGESSVVADESAAWFEKLAAMPVKLGNLANAYSGLQTSAADVFILEEVRKDKKRVLCKSKATGRKHWFEDEHLKPFVKGSLNIRRYRITDLSKRLIFPYEIRDGKSVLIDPREYKRRYPLTWAYLEKNRRQLARRKKGKMGRGWYGYVYRKNHTRFGAPRLLVPSVGTGSCCAYDLDGRFYFGGDSYGIELPNQDRLLYLVLLGLLNSKLLNAYLLKNSKPSRGRHSILDRQSLEQLPIPTINFSDSNDAFRHHRIVTFVTQLLALHKQLSTTRTAADREMYQHLIDANEVQIDSLAYALYGLTENEIQVVEGKTI